MGTSFSPTLIYGVKLDVLSYEKLIHSISESDHLRQELDDAFGEKEFRVPRDKDIDKTGESTTYTMQEYCEVMETQQGVGFHAVADEASTEWEYRSPYCRKTFFFT